MEEERRRERWLSGIGFNAVDSLEFVFLALTLNRADWIGCEMAANRKSPELSVVRELK